MATLPSIKLTSPITQAAAPVAVGHGFKKGDIPSGQYLTTNMPNLACVPLATWNDGSLKHARIVGRVATVANVPVTVQLNTTSTPPGGVNLTAASISAASPSASVQCGVIGTVTLSSLLASPVRTWISTPEMVECHYRQAIAGTNLLVWFQVRLFAGGAVFVRAIVENGYLDNGAGAPAVNADSIFIPTATVGGVAVYSNDGAPLTSCRNARWKAEGWIGTDPQVTPAHDGAFLRATKLVPNYAYSSYTSAQLDALVQSVPPMGAGGIPKNMASAGANPSIAIMPLWDAAYIGTSDPRAYRAVLAGSDALNAFSIVWRDFTTKEVIKPNSFPRWSTKGHNGSNISSVDLSNGCDWEINHHPGVGYLAYLLTGDYWHYETMLLQVSAMWAMRGTASISNYTGIGTSRVIGMECRGTAWSIRSMSQLCGLMPDSEKADGKIGAEYRELLANNMLYWKSVSDRPSINGLGMLYEYNGNAGYEGIVTWKSPWQTFWWIQSQGFGSDIEPLADMSTYIAVRDHMYKFVVGMAGDPATGFPYNCMAVHNVIVADSTNHNPELWFDSFRDVATRTFAHLPGGVDSIIDTNTLLTSGDMSKGELIPSTGGAGRVSVAADGRWGYLLPALSYAKEHNATGAEASWSRVENASNFVNLVSAFTNQSSQWGVFPRTAEASTVQGHATGRTIRFGRLRPGFITISKYHGLGTPITGIATGAEKPSLGETKILPTTPTDAELLLDVEKPSAGDFTLNEDTSFSFLNAPTGSYVGDIEILLNGMPDSGAYEFNIGDVIVVPPTSTVTSVTVSPSSATGSTTFAAVVNGTNSPSQAVNWTRSPAVGSITSNGIFNAPAQTSVIQTITITATSVQDPTKSGTATVTIAAAGTPNPTVTGVTISPVSATLLGLQSQQFDATVVGTNSPSQAVTWTKQSGVGSVSGTGLYTAPASTSSVQGAIVRAASNFDPTKFADVAITILAVDAPPDPDPEVTFLESVAPSVIKYAGSSGDLRIVLTFSDTHAPRSRTIVMGSQSTTITSN